MGSRGPTKKRRCFFLVERQVSGTPPSFYECIPEGSLTKKHSFQRRPRIDMGSVFKPPLSKTKFRCIRARKAYFPKTASNRPGERFRTPVEQNGVFAVFGLERHTLQRRQRIDLGGASQLPLSKSKFRCAAPGENQKIEPQRYSSNTSKQVGHKIWPQRYSSNISKQVG